MLLAHFRADSASQNPCGLGHPWSAGPTLVVPIKGRRKGVSSAPQLNELDRIKNNAMESKWINSPDFIDLPEQSGLKNGIEFDAVESEMRILRRIRAGAD
jgi:hypothetical protein